jgi:hypothetical protein
LRVHGADGVGDREGREVRKKENAERREAEKTCGTHVLGPRIGTISSHSGGLTQVTVSYTSREMINTFREMLYDLEVWGAD